MISDRLREIIKKADMSQQKFADAAGVHRSHIIAILAIKKTKEEFKKEQEEIKKKVEKLSLGPILKHLERYALSPATIRCGLKKAEK